jgi:hypothetical protein
MTVMSARAGPLKPSVAGAGTARPLQWRSPGAHAMLKTKAK